jgi:hypothetical protein
MANKDGRSEAMDPRDNRISLIADRESRKAANSLGEAADNSSLVAIRSKSDINSNF